VSVSQSPETPYSLERVPEVWRKVPQRNKNFTGREMLLDHLWEGMTANVTAVVPHALHGMGGVGKTQVAIEYAYRYRAQYDLVVWIPADQPVLVSATLAGLAQDLGLPPASATGIEDAADAVLNALRRGDPFNRWLLIFDNADRPEDLNEIVPRGPGHVLITSRNHSWQGVVDTVPIDVFSRPESIAFLSKRVPRSMSDGDAERLAEQLGDLPLALEQAGALQAETGMSASEYLRLLSEHTQRLLGEGKPMEYPLSMSAAWALSVSQLAEKLPEAVEVLRCCAFFGPEPIPRDVFSMLPAGYGEIRLTPLLDNPILLSRAIRELGRFALAKVESRSRTIQVHRLIQALIRDELLPGEQDRIRHEVHLLLAAAAPKTPDDVAVWPRYADLLAHVRPARVAASSDPSVREFSLDLARYLFSSGDFPSARSFINDFIVEWEAVSGPQHLDVLVGRRHLGAVLRELGDYKEAYDLNRGTLEMLRHVLPPDDEETLRLTNSHGADLRARGEFQLAREHDEDSRRRHEAKFGFNDRRTLRTINNLAVDYALISDYTRSRELHEAAYKASGAGVSRQDTVAWLNGLARIVRLLGDYNEACDLGEDAYSLGVAELTVEHHWTLRAAKDLSIAQRRAGLVDDGFELAKETYERERRIFGIDHADTLAAAMSMANALRSKGDVDGALELARETAELYPALYGPNHPYNFGAQLNLALLLRVHGDTREALERNRSALAGLDATVTRDHHYSLTCAVNLASDLAELKDPQGARELGEDTLRRLIALLGQDHPLTLACAANLAVDLQECGIVDEADRLWEDSIARYARALGSEHPDVVVASKRHRLDFDFDPPPI
jgi:tetratricopeptide (TPR) repeat protein